MVKFFRLSSKFEAMFFFSSIFLVPCHLIACAMGKGTCNSHQECAGALICGFNEGSCGTSSGLGPGTSCCTDSFRCDGMSDDCCTSATPCGKGDGDCDNNSQCLGDLTCGTNNCDQSAGDFNSYSDCCT